MGILGLITKEVYINITSNIIQHYENLGYIIPKKKASESTYKRYKKEWVYDRNEKIKIKVEDLMDGSGVYVDARCDCCNKTLKNIEWRDYKEYIHNDNKYYCNSCGKKILNSGESNYKWNSSLTNEDRERDRSKNPRYTEWVKKVLKRDNYICQCCEKEHKILNAHHLNSWDKYKEQRYDETNGITLCDTCHKNFHSIYGYGDNTKEQYEEWIGQAIEVLKYDGELPTTRKIYCIEEDKIYNSVKKLAKEWNTTPSNIYKVCNHDVVKANYIRKDGSIHICEYIPKSIKGKHLLWLDEWLLI